MAACIAFPSAIARGALRVRAHSGCGVDHDGKPPQRIVLGASGRSSKVLRSAAAAGFAGNVMAAAAEPEQIEAFLDGLKYDDKGLLVAIAQDVDTGAILMQGFADRTAVRTTITAKKATFFSRSRQAQWTKGETSGNFISVKSIHLDCDKDSLIYMGVPDGPTCHTGAHTCYFSPLTEKAGAAEVEDGVDSGKEEALSTPVRARGDDQEATRRGSRRRDEAVVDSSPLGQSRAPVREGQRGSREALRDAREGRGEGTSGK